MRADSPQLTLYLSLNCPFSALANYRVSWLQATSRAAVDVRLVCRPEDRARRPVVGALHQQLTEDVRAVRDLLVEGPVFPIRTPSALPDVSTVVEQYAGHHDRGHGVRDRRVRLFRGLWLRGQDISDPDVLDALEITEPPAVEVAQRWQDHWDGDGRRSLPLLIGPAGRTFEAVAALDELLRLRDVDA